jgi:hypothetical protein
LQKTGAKAASIKDAFGKRGFGEQIEAPMDNLGLWPEDLPHNCHKHAQNRICPYDENVGCGSPANGIQAPGRLHPQNVKNASHRGGLPESGPPDALDSNAFPVFLCRIRKRVSATAPVARPCGNLPATLGEPAAKFTEKDSAYDIIRMKIMIENKRAW